MALPDSCANKVCSTFVSTGNHRGICPLGWHLPKTEQWDTLVTFLGGVQVAGKKMKSSQTGTSDWDYNTHNDGNSSGFTGYPAGYVDEYGNFNGIRYYGYIWEATEKFSIYARFRTLLWGSDAAASSPYWKTLRMSVRCAKD